MSVNESVGPWFVLASLLVLLASPSEAVNLSILLIADLTITACRLDIAAIGAFVRVGSGSVLGLFLLQRKIDIHYSDCHLVVVTDFVLAHSVVLDVP